MTRSSSADIYVLVMSEFTRPTFVGFFEIAEGRISALQSTCGSAG